VKLTAQQLNRATLGRQLLLGREDIGVVDAIHRVCALQAQSPASPYIALWNRVTDFDPDDLDRAFASDKVIKATLIRVALHVVTAADYPAFHRAMVHLLRAARLHDSRFTGTGLSIAEADALLPEVLKFAAKGHTNAEFEVMLAKRLGSGNKSRVWWALRTFGPFWHVPTGGPWSFGDRPSYIASRIKPFAGSEDEALGRLVWRSLEAFGPSSEADIGAFTFLRRPAVLRALGVLAGTLVTYGGPDGKRLYDVPSGLLPPPKSPAPPRLLGMWDNVLLAYKDRTRVVPEAYRKVVIRNNGDVLPTVLTDGYVGGVWRPAPAQPGAIEVTAFHPFSKSVWRGLEAEAGSLVAFLAGRGPQVYRRYARWWNNLPAAEVRLLAG
jgi:hypothetical protein